jgi:hypothetical protein
LVTAFLVLANRWQSKMGWLLDARK